MGSNVCLEHLPDEATDLAWEHFREALMPLHSAGKLALVPPEPARPCHRSPTLVPLMSWSRPCAIGVGTADGHDIDRRPQSERPAAPSDRSCGRCLTGTRSCQRCATRPSTPIRCAPPSKPPEAASQSIAPRFAPERWR